MVARDVEPARGVQGRVADVEIQSPCTLADHDRAGDLLPLAAAGEGADCRTAVLVVGERNVATGFVEEPVVKYLHPGVQPWQGREPVASERVSNHECPSHPPPTDSSPSGASVSGSVQSFFPRTKTDLWS